jgi:hypothetical protein
MCGIYAAVLGWGMLEVISGGVSGFPPKLPALVDPFTGVSFKVKVVPFTGGLAGPFTGVPFAGGVFFAGLHDTHGNLVAGFAPARPLSTAGGKSRSLFLRLVFESMEAAF